MSNITCFGEASGEVRSRHCNLRLGYWREVMPLLSSTVETNCQMGSVDVDVEMSRRKQLWCRTINQS